MSAEKIQLFHEEMIQEEGLKVSELPIEIQKKIRGFNLMKANYEKNPQERELINLRKRAIKLGDAVQNFIENDYDEDEDEGEAVDKSSNGEAVDKSSNGEEKPKNEKVVKSENNSNSDTKGDNPVRQKPISTGGKFGNLMMEKKILAIMEAKGEKRIKISDLETIIGREPEYPEQIVNNIKLRKVFLSYDYRLV
jgi:hypothetical protein